MVNVFYYLSITFAIKFNNFIKIKGVFGLGRRWVGIWESWCVKIWEESVKKVCVFGLKYVRVDIWEKIIEIYELCDGGEKILIFFNDVKCKLKNVPLFLKIFE